MNAIIDLILVALVTIYIVDLSGFTETWLNILSNYRGRKITGLKPFSCSQCMVWWVCLIFSLVTGECSIPVVAFIALLSFLSLPLGQLLMLIREVFLKVINKIMNVL